MRILKIGLVGCGAIGSYLAGKIDSEPDKWQLCAIHDISSESAKNLQAQLNTPSPILPLDSMAETCDILVEAAGVAAVPQVVKAAVRYQRPLVIISIGGLLIYPELLPLIKEHSLKIHLPAGALAGLDALRAARQAPLSLVRLHTRKPLKSVAGAPYLTERGIDLNTIDSATVIFSGNAYEAVQAFPKNINVAATVSLAGIGPEKTEIIIEVSPDYTHNSHELIVEGDFGSFRTLTENLAFPRNPKTSFLAALSCIETISSLL